MLYDTCEAMTPTKVNTSVPAVGRIYLYIPTKVHTSFLAVGSTDTYIDDIYIYTILPFQPLGVYMESIFPSLVHMFSSVTWLIQCDLVHLGHDNV